jgi:hypothetical protein
MKGDAYAPLPGGPAIPFVPASAVVHGFTAVVLAQLLTDRLAGRLDELELDDDQRTRVVATVQAIRLAGEVWQAASVRESAPAPPAKTAAPSDGMNDDRDLLDAEDAADLLGCTPTRVRQLAVAAGLGKTAGRWLFRPDDVEALRTRRIA